MYRDGSSSRDYTENMPTLEPPVVLSTCYDDGGWRLAATVSQPMLCCSTKSTILLVAKDRPGLGDAPVPSQLFFFFFFSNDVHRPRTKPTGHFAHRERLQEKTRPRSFILVLGSGVGIPCRHSAHSNIHRFTLCVVRISAHGPPHEGITTCTHTCKVLASPIVSSSSSCLDRNTQHNGPVQIHKKSNKKKSTSKNRAQVVASAQPPPVPRWNVPFRKIGQPEAFGNGFSSIHYCGLVRTACLPVPVSTLHSCQPATQQTRNIPGAFSKGQNN